MNKKFVKALAVLSVSSILGGNIAFASEAKTYKNETVYVTKEAGKVTDQTVSVWINKDGKKEIKDKSDLKEIKNLETDEKIEAKDGFIDINSKDKDFYYQGKTDKDLPVDVQIRYELDGKAINFKDLEGKSGKLKVTIIAHNKVKESLKSGKAIYAPYLVMTEMTFADDQVKNIEAVSAKIVKDGKNQIVVGVLAPGLRENFAGLLGDEKLDKFKDQIEIVMDVENFKPGEAYVVITNEIFQDGKSLGSFDDLEGGLDELTANAGKLVDGSEKLKDGSKSLNKGISTLADESEKLSAGSEKLIAGFDQMSGAFASLPEKIGPMETAISALDKGGANLNQGLNQYTGGISEINSKMGDLMDGADRLNQGAINLNTGIERLSQGSKELRDKLSQDAGGSDLREFATSLKALKAGIDDFSGNISPMAEFLERLNQGLKSASDSSEKISKSLAELSVAGENSPNTEEVISNINKNAAGLENQIASLEAKNTDGSFTSEIENLRAIKNELYGQSQKLGASAKVNAEIYAGLKNLSGASNELTSGLNKLSLGLGEMSEKLGGSKDGLEEASVKLGAGIEKVESGLSDSDLMKLGKALSQLDEGLDKLKEGSENLVAGTEANKEGVKKLGAGLNLLDSKSADLREGSEKLSGGLSEFKERSKALSELGSVNDKALNPMAKGLSDLNKGILNLRAGALKLQEGSNTYNEKYEEFDSGLRRYKAEGIDKLAGKTGDIKEIGEILDQMSNLAKKNNSISGSTDDIETRSRIIEKIR
ncbi:hypothetical protein [uncultured Anaerococcus sp.]|uniref:hypothetical protein n=1 Tax=uncultured Anaerococcus sp. TaxID=293428 RepID=UPI00288AD1F4|nr:hypothetical protein [uncultured Anaerococcus sp.]